MIKRPVLCTDALQDAAILYPAKGALNMRMVGESECTLTLAPDSPTVPMHAWVKVYSHKGLAGFFRRTSDNNSVLQDKSITLKHGIDILRDSVWAEETTYEGTVAGFLAAILAKQTALVNGSVPWILGQVDDGTAAYTAKINNQSCLDLLHQLEDEGGEYYYSYDMSTFPWVVSYLKRSNVVSSEFRLSRNIEKIKIAENDSELCNRLYLTVNAMMADQAVDGNLQNKSTVRVYNNAAAQALYGIISRCMDIDTTDTVPGGPFPEADAYAARYLADHAAPVTTITIDGLELSQLTGLAWDEYRLGYLCRVALPDQMIYKAQRISSVSYPDLYGASERCTVTLSNATPSRLREQNALVQSVAANRASLRSVRKSGRGSARQADNFQQHFKITDKNDNILKQAGLKLDANGLLVYATDNVNMVGSKFNVQADKIGMVVGENRDGNYIKAAEIAVSINRTTGEGLAYIDAAHVIISGTTTIQDSMVIEDGSLRVKKAAIFGEAGSDVVSINNGKVAAKTVQVNSGGALSIVGSSDGEYYSINSGVIKTMIKSASVSGNVLTLTPFSGTPITFSKAVATTDGWSNGTYTVTIKQNGTTVDTKTTTIFGGSPTWDDGKLVVPIVYGNAQYPSQTGYTVRANAPVALGAGAWEEYETDKWRIPIIPQINGSDDFSKQIYVYGDTPYDDGYANGKRDGSVTYEYDNSDINVGSAQWAGMDWNTGGKTRFSTLQSQISSRTTAKDRGYIYFTAYLTGRASDSPKVYYCAVG